MNLKKISSYVKSKYSVAFNSATSALHASCASLGVKKMISFGHLL